jgi:hypothetical protein
MERPTVEHQQAVNRILRYVEGTLDYGLHYTRSPNATRVVGYCDSDLADNIDTSKSTSGTLVFLGNRPVSKQSLKQWVVALSSCKAEYVAATSATTQALWLAWLLAKLLGREAKAVELRVDNKSALALAKNPSSMKGASTSGSSITSSEAPGGQECEGQPHQGRSTW